MLKASETAFVPCVNSPSVSLNLSAYMPPSRLDEMDSPSIVLREVSRALANQNAVNASTVCGLAATPVTSPNKLTKNSVCRDGRGGGGGRCRHVLPKKGKKIPKC